MIIFHNDTTLELADSPFQACTSTLALRNMVTPFSHCNLLESACPMDDVLGHIAAQLAEFKALKEQNG